MSSAFEKQMPPVAAAAAEPILIADEASEWGSALDAVASLAPQAPARDETRWFLAVNEKQVGPLTSGEVREMLAADEVDAETLCWRQGLLDWLPLARVVEFVEQTQVSPRPLKLVASAAPEVAGLPEPRPSAVGLKVAELAREEITAKRTITLPDLPAQPAPSSLPAPVPPPAGVQERQALAPVLPRLPSRVANPSAERPRMRWQRRLTALALLDLVLVSLLALSTSHRWRPVRSRPAVALPKAVTREAAVKASPPPPAPLAVELPAPTQVARAEPPTPKEVAPVAAPVKAPPPMEKAEKAVPTSKDVLTPEEIHEGVLAHRRAIFACASEQRTREPKAHGTLVLRWTVLPNGRTRGVHALTPEHAKSYLARCIEQDLTRWKFPPHALQGAPVDFPFKF